MRMTLRWTIAASSVLALAACGDNKRGEPTPPVPTASESGDPAPVEEKSIISAGANIKQDVVQMEPLKLRIGFDEGGRQLSEAALAALNEALASPQMKAGGPIILRGHTDSAGHDTANLRASFRRAEAVRNWLVEHQIDADRITLIALGEQNPARPNANPDGTENEPNRAFNRRVMLDIKLPAELVENVKPDAPTLIEKVSSED